MRFFRCFLQEKSGSSSHLTLLVNPLGRASFEHVFSRKRSIMEARKRGSPTVSNVTESQKRGHYNISDKTYAKAADRLYDDYFCATREKSCHVTNAMKRL